MVRGDTGERIIGTEYYQNMALWSMPVAMEDKVLASFCKEGGLVHRVLKAAGGSLCDEQMNKAGIWRRC